MKRNRGGFGLSALLKLFLNTALWLLFIAQAVLCVSFLVYDYLPLPTAWSQKLLADRLPQGLSARFDRLQLLSDGSIQVIGLQLKSEGIEQSILDADVTEIAFNWSPQFAPPQIQSILLAGGTLYLPSVYSPDGDHHPILRNTAFRITKSETHWQVEHFAALHEDIRLRGAFNIPRQKSATTETALKVDIDQALNDFYRKTSKFSEQTYRIRHFETPTIAFRVNVIDAQTQQIDLNIMSPSLRHPQVTAEGAQIRGSWLVKGLTPTAMTPTQMSVDQIALPKQQIIAKDAHVALSPDQFNEVLNGRWPQLELAASEISNASFTLDGPILKIDPSAFPSIRFSGATGGLNGAVELSGYLDAKLQSGYLRARGAVDLAEIAPPALNEKLPQLTFESMPDYHLELEFKPGFELDRANLRADIQGVSVNGIHFDHLNAYASYQNGLYTIDDLYLQRERQWLNLQFTLDSNTHDYRLTLKGTAIPNEYNSLLPGWWASIFREFEFDQDTDIYGDFIIYGNTQRKAADLYFGHADAAHVSYKNVQLVKGDLIVRGRGRYTELTDMNITSQSGWAKGNIAFTSKLDAVKAPLSVRLDMEAKLTLNDAAKLFGPKIGRIIHDFETEAIPEVRFNAAIFHKAYPTYADKTYFDLSVSCPEPVRYKKIPLEFLNLDLFGRSEGTFLRNVRFGYAGGTGNGSIDIFTPKDKDNHLSYWLKLEGAHQNLALSSLPYFNELDDSLQTERDGARESDDSVVDLILNGEGPIDDPLAQTGFGRFEILNDKLSTIQLLGPLSKILQNTQLNFTSFNLNQMRGEFRFENGDVLFNTLRIDGDQSQIFAPGRMRLADQSLDMRVSVSLFGNAGNPDSSLRKLGDLIAKPLPNLLQFELTGTVREQKLRSLYDPRNFIPRF